MITTETTASTVVLCLSCFGGNFDRAVSLYNTLRAMPFKILRAAPLLHKRRALAKLRHERRHPIAIRLELLRGGVNVRIEDVHQVRDSWFAIRGWRVASHASCVGRPKTIPIADTARVARLDFG